MRVSPEQPTAVADQVAKRKVGPEEMVLPPADTGTDGDRSLDGSKSDVQGWATLHSTGQVPPKVDSGDLRKRGPGARAKNVTPPREEVAVPRVHSAWE